jgi:S-adenosylmethionine:tRNA ribosyltransferase-isomerase
VFNDTRVIPAQLEGQRGQARIGATLHKRIDLRRWQAFVRNAKRLRAGDRVDFGAGVTAIVEARDDEGGFTLLFEGEEPVEWLLERAGRMLPPYIAASAQQMSATADYQTMFAHKSSGHLSAGEGGGHRRPPYAERGSISAEVAERLNAVRARGGRLIAVGTTSLRVMESAADERGILHAWTGETRIFITPGYRFRSIDGLMTNFHLPRSTLFMLVSALMGLERMQAAYSHAITQGYRFYSYGDASLLLPQEASFACASEVSSA